MEQIMIVCPLCGWARPLDKKGSRAILAGKTITSIKGRIRFDMIEPETSPFIDIRESLGKGKGWPRLRYIPLSAIKKHPEYIDLQEQIIKQCKTILEVLRKADE